MKIAFFFSSAFSITGVVWGYFAMLWLKDFNNLALRNSGGATDDVSLEWYYAFYNFPQLLLALPLLYFLIFGFNKSSSRTILLIVIPFICVFIQMLTIGLMYMH